MCQKNRGSKQTSRSCSRFRFCGAFSGLKLQMQRQYTARDCESKKKTVFGRASPRGPHIHREKKKKNPFVLFGMARVFVISAAAKWPVRACVSNRKQARRGRGGVEVVRLRRVILIGCPLFLAGSRASWERAPRPCFFALCLQKKQTASFSRWMLALHLPT